MRRIILALLGTTVGISLLVGLKTERFASPLGLSSAPLDPATGANGAPLQPGQSAGGGNSAGPAGAPGQPPQPGQTGGQPVPAPGAGGTPKPGTTTTAAAPKPGTTTATKTTAPPPASRTITGTAFAATWNGDNYGDMQVKIVVTGTHIDDIVTLSQSNRPKTVSTTLRSQALTAQSANVGNVSGATASSNAYKQSLASAIAKI